MKPVYPSNFDATSYRSLVEHLRLRDQEQQQFNNTVSNLATTYQPLDATLTALAGVTTAADKLIYATGSDAFTTATLTNFARSLLDDADAAAVRSTIAAAGTGVANTFTATQTISSTDAGGAIGPELILDRNSASPAVADGLGVLIFRGRDSGGNAFDYGFITGIISNATNGSEGAGIRIYTSTSGTQQYTEFNPGSMTIIYTDDGGGGGPDLSMWRLSASPAANDLLGQIKWYAQDSGANIDHMATIYAQLLDPTAASEDTNLNFETTQAGTRARRLCVQNGVYTNGASDNGADTISTLKYYYGTGGLYLSTGSGTPEGVVTAPVGSLFLRSDGGATTTLYVKTSGTGNTGWTAK